MDNIEMNTILNYANPYSWKTMASNTISKIHNNMGATAREILRQGDNMAFNTFNKMGATNPAQRAVHYVKDKLTKYIVNPVLDFKQRRVISNFVKNKMNLPRVGTFIDQKLGWGDKKKNKPKKTTKAKKPKTVKPKKSTIKPKIKKIFIANLNKIL